MITIEEISKLKEPEYMYPIYKENKFNQLIVRFDDTTIGKVIESGTSTYIIGEVHTDFTNHTNTSTWQDIAYDEGATKKGPYFLLDKIIKTGSKIAINISEKI